MGVMADAKQALIANNRRARHDYEIVDTLEAGMVLRGPEVKSLRAGKASLGDTYAIIRRGELFLLKLHISAYDPAYAANGDPLRERKLLAHRREIRKWEARLMEKGLTIVPLSVYFRDGRAKVELALARGKRRYDKRQAIREREDLRDTQRTLRRGSRNR
jgi:SsrA-binding protein